MRMDLHRFMLDEMDFEMRLKESFDFFQVALMSQIFWFKVVLEAYFVYEKPLMVMLKTLYPNPVNHSLVISQYEKHREHLLAVLLALGYFQEYQEYLK